MKIYVAAFILAVTFALPEVVRAQRPEPPQVPETIQVPAGYKVFFAGHALGAQGYVCVAVGSAYRWTAFGPQATLFNREGEQTLTHFLSPTPYSQLPNPAWQHSRDSSIV